MRRFVEEADRGQRTLLPECLDDFIDENNPVRAIDEFVDALDLAEMCFSRATPAATGRPSYHPSVLLKLYIYGYLNRVQSSRRLEREAGRNIEVMWLLGRLAPDHKTIADFRKDNSLGLRKVCARFVELCRGMGLLTKASVAIDGSKFKAVNNRDRNFTRAKVERRHAQLEESVARYLSQLDTADRQEPTEALAAKVTRLTEKLTQQASQRLGHGRSHADHAEALGFERRRAGLRAVAADDDQRRNIPRAQLVESFALASGHLELVAATRAEHRAALVDDAANVTRAQWDEIAGDETCVTATDAEHLESARHARTYDRSRCRVHSGRVAPAGQYCNALHVVQRTHACMPRNPRLPENG